MQVASWLEAGKKIERMKKGFLSEYFEGIAVKRLSAVEVDPDTSHQHEFNGVTGLKQILGTDKREFPARFVHLGDNEDVLVTAVGTVTWYDAREAHPTRSEYRLYYTSTPVSEKFIESDLLLVGKQPNGTVMVIAVAAGSTVENQLLWLFGLSDPGGSFTVLEIKDERNIELGFGARYILDELGITVEERDNRYLDIMLKEFSGGFPKTIPFSAFARSTIPEVKSRDGADQALLAWMEREEILFRMLERHLVAIRLREGFGKCGDDVDAFIGFSLSVQNRRKSRAGQALENHLEQIFKDHKILYSRGAETENRAKPDFLFPGVAQYHDSGFPETKLSMLGVKSTCKDRWRQVLSEAAKIKEKHLLTLEPGISENQTTEMQANLLKLVIPEELHQTYRPSQQEWLWNVKDLLQMVRDRQGR